MEEVRKNIGAIRELLVEAGDLIMDIYRSKDFWTEDKDDQSPVTEADHAANDLITKKLPELTSFQIISEEDAKPRPKFDESKPFWLLDPLDGTKHFIKRDGEFVISLGLVTRDTPLAGFIYAPVYNEFYWAVAGMGAYKWDDSFSFHSNRGSFISYSSGFHMREESKEFIKSLDVSTFLRMGSALKLCKIAEGNADLYPRFGPTSEWDVAGAHCILKEAGCRLIEIKTLEEMKYGKPDFLNRGFVAYRGDLDVIPKLKGYIELRKKMKKEKS